MAIALHRGMFLVFRRTARPPLAEKRRSGKASKLALEHTPSSVGQMQIVVEVGVFFHEHALTLPSDYIKRAFYMFHYC